MNSSFDIQVFINKIRACLPNNDRAFGLHEPMFNGNEWNYVKECLDTGWVSSVGKYVDLFEQRLAEFTGAKYAVVTTNGTAALHISLLLADVQPNTEVLVPALTFVATCNAIAYCNATPHFIDSDEKTLGINTEKLASYLQDITQIIDGNCYNRITGKRIAALCVMHTFGHPVDLDQLQAVCFKYKINLVEDAAEALGSLYKGQHVGYRGIAGALSFNGNKIITTGGGGAILTNDEKIARKAKHITTTAKVPHAWRYQHDQVGYNYRLPNINAALGCAQLEQLPEFLAAKRQLALTYKKAFADFAAAEFIVEPAYAQSNYWLNALLLAPQYKAQRDQILDQLNANQLGVRPVWELMHQLPMFVEAPRMDLTVAENLAQRIINIPSSAFLGMDNEKKT